ncbi:MAG TPA: MFS transporter [Actinobacteria bacterium]|nr:MFS transporter [Actinomycetota bacterium]
MAKNISARRLFSITLFRFPQAFIWSSLLLIVIQNQVLIFAPEHKKGSYLSIILAAGALVTLISQPLMGALSDYYKRRVPFIVVGSLAASGLLLSISFSKTIVVFTVFYMFLQLANDVAEAPHYALISDLTPGAQLGEASGFANLMTFSGQILGPLSAGFLLQKVNLLSFYLVAIAVLLASAIIIKINVKEETFMVKTSFDIRQFFNGVRLSFARSSDFKKVLIAQFFIMLALYSITAFFQFFVKDTLGVKEFTLATGYLVSAATTVALISAYFVGLTIDKIGFKKITIMAGSIFITLTMILITTKSYALTLVLATFFGLAQGILATVTLTLAMKALPNDANHGRDLGIWASVSIISQLIAPIIGGPILDKFNLIKTGLGYQVVFSIAVVYLIIGVLFILRINESRIKLPVS